MEDRRRAHLVLQWGLVNTNCHDKVFIHTANEVAGVYSDPYVRPFVRSSVRPSVPISNRLLH